MNLKITALLLLLLALADLSAAIEPLYIGRGVSDQVVNLDTGAAKPGIQHYFSRSGFVPPSVPQVRIVSTSIYLYQAEKLRDEAQAIHDDTERLHNLTMNLAEQAEMSLEEIKELREEIRSDAQSSSKNAAQAKESAVQAEQHLDRIFKLYDDTFKLYNDTFNLYSETLDIYNDTINQSEDIKVLADETRDNKEASARYLVEAEGYLNDVRSLFNSTLNLTDT